MSRGRDENEMGEERFCEHCGRWIEPNEVRYEMTITLRAEARPPEIHPEAPGQSSDEIGDELARLIESMQRMSAEQVEEATDQVHESYQFSLCPTCRGDMHRRLKRRVRILDVE